MHEWDVLHHLWLSRRQNIALNRGKVPGSPLPGSCVSGLWLSVQDEDDDLDDDGDDDEQEDEDDDADVISLSEQHLHFRAVPDARSSFWMHIKIIVHRINCKRLVEKHTRYDPHDTEINCYNVEEYQYPNHAICAVSQQPIDRYPILESKFEHRYHLRAQKFQSTNIQRSVPQVERQYQ